MYMKKSDVGLYILFFFLNEKTTEPLRINFCVCVCDSLIMLKDAVYKLCSGVGLRE